MIDLVVARYQEDVAWLGNVPPSLRVFLYNKGPALTLPSRVVLPLPNVGREAQTYLHHIVHHYDHLAKWTFFCQGRPFDHAPNLHPLLRAAVRDGLPGVDFQWLGFLVDTDDERGRRLFIPWSKNPSGEELPLDVFYQELFAKPSPHRFRFYGGAQFVVRDECVRRQPLSFYQRALKMTECHRLAAHCLERIWDQVFGVCGVTDEWMQGRDTVLLKPVKPKRTNYTRPPA